MGPAGDFIHTTAEYTLDGELGGGEITFVLAELSSENGAGPAWVSIDGTRLTPKNARRLAIQILELAAIAEDR